MNKKLDYSHLNAVELKAISIHMMNVQNGEDNPTFPYTAATLEELAENLTSIAMIAPSSALKMVEELNAINKVLVKLAPVPPVRTETELAALFSDEEITQNLLACNVCHFLVSQFTNITKQMIEGFKAVEGGQNATKH
ncbi:hypothetical protein NYR76_02855 [Actinobacillus equuli subsp. equuli]|uniref:hypothetical protein n=1 Tax=Actinobacillus equuli TaxID=718 RepID=UPI00244362AA|nr:hypothetical protein [Actinobacillus equuli]WGE65916.1 hypothetical protein NYR76_02855 [Actinobacillus equuli subsp. equuli]